MPKINFPLGATSLSVLGGVEEKQKKITDEKHILSVENVSKAGANEMRKNKRKIPESILT